MSSIIVLPSALDPIRKFKQFSKHAPALRKHFEGVFRDPLKANASRFCWDYWNVPNQYRLLRTPAEDFFGPLGQKLIRELTQFGRDTLGCQMISHPWLSSYLDGHYQGLHSDVPHGPFSFVFSLSPYSDKEWPKRPFRGGETLVAKPKLLRYFRELKSDQSDEMAALFEQIPQPLNQLTVFDPRYPHGVSRVEGNDDLLQSRLVIHGWFTEPRPMLEGALKEAQAGPSMDWLAEHWMSALKAARYTGLLTQRFYISASGNLTRTEVLCAHLTTEMGDPISETMIRQLHQPIANQAKGLFPKSKGPSVLTLPIEFKA